MALSLVTNIVKHRQSRGNEMSKSAKKPQPKQSRVTAFVTGRPYSLLLAIALSFSTLMLSPLLRSAFLGDDADNSLMTASSMAFLHDSVLATTWRIFVQWITVEGRFFPLAQYTLPLFYAFGGNRLLFKWFILALIIAGTGLFSWLVRRVSHSDALGIAAAFVPTLAMQMMYFYDSLLGFAGLVQLVFLLTVGALLLFTFYLDTGRRRFAVSAVALYVASLLMYEITFPFFLLFVPLALYYPTRRTVKEAARKASPFAAGAVLVAVSLVVMRSLLHVRVVAGAAASAYQLNLNPGGYLRTLAIQTFGALPLSYSSVGSGTWGRTGLFASPLQYLTRFPLTSLIALVGYAALVWLFAVVARAEPDRTPAGRSSLTALAWLGGALLLLPSTMIGLSSRWATELAWGVAYIPVFVAYFGFALLVCVGAYRLVRATRRGSAGIAVVVVLALAAGTLGFTNLQNNRLVVSEWDGWRFGREMIASATERGLFGDSSPKSLLFVANRINSRQPWDVPQYYAAHGAVFSGGVMAASSVDVAKLDAAASSKVADAAGNTVYDFAGASPSMYVDYVADAGTGYAMAARVASATVSGQSIVDMGLQPTAVYLENHPERTGPKDSFGGSAKEGAAPFTLEALGLDPQSWKVASSGTGWQLYVPVASSAPAVP